MASAGLDVTWAHTGTPNMTNPYNNYSPVLDVGLGFGDLPKSLNILRPLAVTAELSETIPGQAWTDGNPNPTSSQLGLHRPIQPALLQFARRPRSTTTSSSI